MSTKGGSDPLLSTIGLPIPFVRIRSVYDALPRSERKVADYALAHADELIHASVTDLAQRLDVSESTIVRFCQRLDYQGYQEFKILESGLLLPLFSFPVMNKRVFQAFADLMLISVSFYFSFVLIFNNFGSHEKNLLIRTLPIVLLVKIVVFFLSGLYKRSWFHFGAEDLLTLGKSLVLSSIGCLLVLGLVFGLSSFEGILFFMLDFYLSATFIMGYRVSFKLVRQLYNGNSLKKGRKVLIYGAGYKGSIALEEVKKNEDVSF